MALGLATFVAGCGDGTGAGSGGTGGTASTGGTGATGGSGGTGGATGGAGGTASTGGTGGSGAIDVTLAFDARVGAEPFDCNATYQGLGMAGSEAKLTEFRLYLHDVKLLDKNGAAVPVELTQDGLWQYQGVALLDFESKEGACANGTMPVNMAIKGQVPAGEYDGVSFKLGVPFELNHADVATAPSPLNLSAMFWSWNGGYKFLRVDATVTGSDKSFNLHLGSTGCVNGPDGKVESCERSNRPEVVLTGFDPLTSPVVIDYAAVVSESDLSTDAGGAPGCMSGATDPECVAVFSHLGIDIADGSIHPEEQVFFSAP